MIWLLMESNLSNLHIQVIRRAWYEYEGPLRKANLGFSPLKYYINEKWNEKTDWSNSKITSFGTLGGSLIVESTHIELKKL